jgi:hypothetical protein
MNGVEYIETEEESFVKVKCTKYEKRDGHPKFVLCIFSTTRRSNCPIIDKDSYNYREGYKEFDNLTCDSKGTILIPSLYYPIFIRKDKDVFSGNKK